jgi:hypothetical protein
VWPRHQREKKKYDKSRANYDAAVLKVRSINAKKGQVNLEKLAEAEDERDRLKEVPPTSSSSFSVVVIVTISFTGLHLHWSV